jgi:UDP-N-acetylglucosamine pyrophosphorylase
MKPVFAEKSDRFAQQILKTDFGQLELLYRSLVLDHRQEAPDKADSISPAKSLDKQAASAERKAAMTESGYDAIRRHEVAAVTMAGGQGTRLGSNGPKGTFLLQTVPPKSLFELQCRQLQDIRDDTGVSIPWLVMTSEENHEATVKFFEHHDFFGYGSSNVQFFSQEMIPIIDLSGKVIVGENGLATGPNGNGGIFSTLRKTGRYQWLKEQGIKKVFVCGIDNALVKVADPLFIGFSIESGTPIACKSSAKRSFDEKAGIFCYQSGRPSYLEYTEIPAEKAKAVDEQGNFLYGDIGIVMYVFDMDVLDRIAQVPLPYHVAKKKTPILLPNGDLIKPEKENSIKFETFIFDSFHLVEDVSILRVPREEEFAPIKNKDGEDSPKTALALYTALHQ